jgi:hypothetical protein
LWPGDAGVRQLLGDLAEDEPKHLFLAETLEEAQRASSSTKRHDSRWPSQKGAAHAGGC